MGRKSNGNETGGRATEGWATNGSDGGGRLAQCHPVRTCAGAGMGEGARRIRKKDEEKQTSILLVWCHLGTGIMGCHKCEAGQRRYFKHPSVTDVRCQPTEDDSGVDQWRRHGRMLKKGNGWRCKFALQEHRSHEERWLRKILYSFHFLAFRYACASCSMPPNGQRASLYAWHARSNQSRWQKTVVVKDKRTHLWGDVSNLHVFARGEPAKKMCLDNGCQRLGWHHGEQGHR